MNIETKLYVHGIPYGQKMWGVPNFDNSYIESFYRNVDMPVQMFVENRQIESHKYSYYTYYRAGSIFDAKNRSGSYFALTLRLNYYYEDVQNIYNVLDAAFNKFIVGTVLKKNEVGYVFNDQNLTQFEGTFVALEQELYKYLMQFSSDNDFLPLNGFAVNSKTEAVGVNLLEFTSKAIANHIKSKGNISVSPLFSTQKEQKLIQNMNSEIAAAQKKANEQVASAEHKAQADIKAVKEQYKDVDKTINSYKAAMQKKEDEVTKLQHQIKNLSNENSELKGYKKDYDKLRHDYENNKKIIDGVRKSLSELENISKLLGVSNPPPSASKKNDVSFIKFVKFFHPFVDFLVMAALLIICAVSLPKSCASDKGADVELSNAQATIDSLNQQLAEKEQMLAETKNIVPEVVNDYKDLKIDVKGISNKKPMKRGIRYFISLSGENIPEEGKWISEDFIIKGDSIEPKHTGVCIISRVINGKEITRKINVVE